MCAADEVAAPACVCSVAELYVRCALAVDGAADALSCDGGGDRAFYGVRWCAEWCVGSLLFEDVADGKCTLCISVENVSCAVACCDAVVFRAPEADAAIFVGEEFDGVDFLVGVGEVVLALVFAVSNFYLDVVFCHCSVFSGDLVWGEGAGGVLVVAVFYDGEEPCVSADVCVVALERDFGKSKGVKREY